MKICKILVGNCEQLLSDFIEVLFRGACGGDAEVRCSRAVRVGEFVRKACDEEHDLIILVPHNLMPENNPPTPIALIGESIEALRTIRGRTTSPVISIVAAEERKRYEPLLLEAGADCVLELPFDGEDLRQAVIRLLQSPVKQERATGKRWFFAGVLTRGFQRLSGVQHLANPAR